ncbi:MAG: hypothetical protein ACJAT7_001329 [Psychromonas sp.]|jgi:hypothetical protein
MANLQVKEGSWQVKEGSWQVKEEEEGRFFYYF